EPCVVPFTLFCGCLVGFIRLFIVACALRRGLPAGNVFWLSVLWYSVLRSVIEEPFRDNPLPWQVYLNAQAGVGLFTYTQLASIPIVLVALYMLLTAPERERARRPAQAK